MLLWRKDKLYYKVYLGKDLFEQWVVTKAWGNVERRGGQVRQILLKDQAAGLAEIEKVKRLRQKSGYVLVTPEDNHYAFEGNFVLQDTMAEILEEEVDNQPLFELMAECQN